MTEWTLCVYAVCEAADRDAANKNWAAAVGDPVDANTFIVALSPDGTGQPSNYGTATALTPSLYAALQTQLADAGIASLKAWCCDAVTGELQDTIDPTALSTTAPARGTQTQINVEAPAPAPVALAWADVTANEGVTEINRGG